MPSSHRIAGPLALLALAACGAPGPADEDAPLVLTDADVHVLGTSDSIAVVEDLAVLDDGTVWIQNSVEPLFLGFDAAGDLLAAHGRRGGGPEELGAPAGLVVGGLDGEAWTLDRRRHALIRVSAPGEPRAEVSLPRDAIPPGSVMGGMSLMSNLVRTASLGGEIVLPRRRGAGEVSAAGFWTTIWNADLVAVDPATGRVRTVVSLPDVLGDLEAHFADVSAGFPPFPFWYRLWAVCGDREVRLYDFRGNQLRGFAPDGTALDPVPLPPPPFTQVTPRQFVRTLFDLIAAERAGAVTPGVGRVSASDSARLIQGAVSRLEGTPEEHAAVLPQYVDFRCDDDGAIWLRPLDLDAGGMRGTAHWLRIDPDGGVREVRFPERFDPYRFADGRVWGVVRDELDVASVGWVEVAGE